MNELMAVPQRTYPIVPVEEIRARMQAIKSLIEGAMQQDVHYGKIPGTPKPTLYQPGADLILAIFRIGVRFESEDLSTSADHVRYRVRCIAFNQATGELLGEGMGEASSDEAKYRWRKSICDEEFEATPENRKRVKFNKGQNHSQTGAFYKEKQVRTDPADSANTVLKMAVKRAKLGACLTVAGCSDFFSQDMEELDDEPKTGQGKPPASEPKRKSASKGVAAAPAAAAPAAGEPPAAATGQHGDMTGEIAWINNKLKETGRQLPEVLAAAGVESLEHLNPDTFKAIKKVLMS